MGEVLAHAALERVRLCRCRRSVGRIGIELNVAMQPLKQQVQQLEIVGSRVGTHARR